MLAETQIRLPVRHSEQGVGFHAPTTVFWEANATDALGNIIQQTLGNSVQVIRGFDEINGLPDYLQAGPGGSGSLQDLAFAGGAAGIIGSGYWHGPANFMERGPHQVPPKVF